MVDARNFAERIEPLGITLAEGRRLHRYFAPRQGAQFITLDDISIKAGAALLRGDRELYEIPLPKKIKPKIPLTKGYENLTESTLRCRELSLEDRENRRKRVAAEAALDCGLSS